METANKLQRVTQLVFVLLFVTVSIVNICNKKYDFHIYKTLKGITITSTNAVKYPRKKSIFARRKEPKWPEWVTNLYLQPWQRKKNSRNEKSTPVGKRAPDVIGIGVKKCGTTAVLEFLKSHPHFVPAEIKGGELHFFDTEDYFKGVNFYQSQMPFAKPNDVTFEKSPKYFYTPIVPGRIKAFNPDIKLVLVLCDPVNRTLSDFVHVMRRSKTFISETFKVFNFTSFDEFVDNALKDLDLIRKQPYESLGYSSFESFVQNAYNSRTFPLTLLTNGIYAYHLRNWLSLFPQDQIHLVDGDSLLQNPGDELERLQRFMGLEVMVTSRNFYFNASSGFYCMINKPCLKQKGTTRGVEGPSMSNYARKKLINFFKPYNDELFALVHKTFNWH